MIKWFKKNRELVLISLIILLAFALRVYKLSEMASFDFDQEYAANFAYSVIKIFPIQLIGEGLSVQGLFMGPIYFYLLTPFFFLSSLHPIGGAFGSVVIGVITVGSYYFILKNVFGSKAALIAAFLRAILFTRIQADWSMAPAFSSELIVIFTWFFLYQYWKEKMIFLIPLGFLFGLYTSFHPILFPFYIIFLILLLIKRRLPNLKIFLLSVVAFVLPLTPLILFEYLHNLLEIKLLLSFGHASTEVKNLKTFYDYVALSFNGLSNFLGLDKIPNSRVEFISLGLLLVFLFAFWKKIGFLKESFHLIFLLLTVGVFITYNFVLPTHSPDYYFLPIIVIFFIYLSGILGFLKKEILIMILLAIFLLNFSSLLDRWNNKSLFTMYNKDGIVKAILDRQPKNRDFSITYIVDPGWQYGFDYLFKLYGRKPGYDYTKNNYKVFLPASKYPDAKYDFTSGGIGLIYSK